MTQRDEVDAAARHLVGGGLLLLAFDSPDQRRAIAEAEAALGLLASAGFPSPLVPSRRPARNRAARLRIGGQGVNGAPSKRSIVVNASTGCRRSLVGWCSGTPRKIVAARA